jgi:protein involved in polysaccharide export with SLBB domain
MRHLALRAVVKTLCVWLCLAICGCGANKVSEQEQQAYVAASTAAPRLQAGEKIRVTVFGEDKLSGDYDIDPNGLVSLPLAGTVKAAGLTQAELEAQLATKFRSEYLKNPKVTVAIASFRPFYIMGEVERPGEYQYKSGLNVLSAAAMAGGTTYRASRTNVLIQRAGETAMREYPLATTVPVLPGDLIRIPERYF